MEFIVEYQWHVFIVIEILSWLLLLLFGISRYLFNRKAISVVMLGGFILFIFIEALLALFVYTKTGVISNFQVIVIIFVLYACTFGIADFKKLDRWMKQKIGVWRGIDILTEKDKEMMDKQKDPKYIARKYRISSVIHTIIFIVVQFAFWLHGTGSVIEMKGYLTDFSWIESDNAAPSPYANETIFHISMLWGIVFAVDFIYSWSYTIFPSKSK